MSGHSVASLGKFCMCIMAMATVFLMPMSSQGLVLQTNMEQYEPGQTVMIFGDVEVVPTGDAVSIQIFDDVNNRAHIQQVNVTKDGRFVAVVEKRFTAGNYTIHATYNSVPSSPASFWVIQPDVPIGPDTAEPEGVKPTDAEAVEQAEPEGSVQAEPSNAGTVQRDLPTILYELGLCLIDTSCGFWYLALVAIFVTLGVGTHRMSRRGRHKDGVRNAGPQHDDGMQGMIPPSDATEKEREEAAPKAKRKEEPEKAKQEEEPEKAKQEEEPEKAKQEEGSDEEPEPVQHDTTITVTDMPMEISLNLRRGDGSIYAGKKALILLDGLERKTTMSSESGQVKVVLDPGECRGERMVVVHALRDDDTMEPKPIFKTKITFVRDAGRGQEPEDDVAAEPVKVATEPEEAAKHEGKPESDDDWQAASKITRNRIVVFDTNVCISYLFHKISAGDGTQEKYVRRMRNRKMAKKMLYSIDTVISEGRFRLPERMVNEFQSILHRDLDDGDKKAIDVPIGAKITMYDLIENELKQLNREKHKMLQPMLDSNDAPCKVGHKESDLARVVDMRKNLEDSNDLGKTAHGVPKKPEDVLDDGDMEILATAMSFSDRDAIPCLFTMDSDFIKHKDMIMEELGVEVVGEYDN